MATVVLHPCSCNFVSDNSLCPMASLNSCFSRRHALSTSDFVGSWAVASLLKLKFKNAIPVVRVEGTIALETQIPIDEANMSTDAAKAVALAKEAVQAAKYVAALSSLHDCAEDFISETDLLRLQRARLTKMELNFFDFHERRACQINADEANTSSGDHLNNHGEIGTLEHPEEAAYVRKGESVAVRSMRRNERLVKRKRASAKTRNAAGAAATASPGRPSRSRKVPAQRAVIDPIRSFLLNNGSGKPKLLTAAEEVKLSHKIQDLLALEAVKATLQKQIGRQPTLTEWASAVHMEIGAFSTRLTEGQQCKDTMIRCNLRLVISVARKYQGKGLSVQDLIQEGSMGLIRGCEKFDPNKGFKFSTYAHWWIRQAVTRSILEHSRLVRLPAHLFDTLLRVRRARRILWQKHDCPPCDADVARLTGISLEKLRLVSRASKACKSMEKSMGKDMNWNLGDIIHDASMEPPECKIAKQLIKEDLNTVLMTLKPREKDVVKLRFGLDDGKRRTLEEIGKLFHVTRERIRQIECKAMKKLKHPERSEVLRGLLSDC